MAIRKQHAGGVADRAIPTAAAAGAAARQRRSGVRRPAGHGLAAAAFAAAFAAAALAGAVAPAGSAPAASPAPAACKGTIYLTFDTGSQSQAELIAQTLRRHRIQATFFLANEKTVRGDDSLDPSWAPFWRALAADGHAFGSHTFDHVYWQQDLAGGKMRVKPQFGPNAGQAQTWDAQQFCAELQRVDQRFQQLAGRKLDPFWRAPGGKTSPHTLAAAKACGYAHAGWAKAGFSGDELSSSAWPNAVLLEKSLRELRGGDIFMAHMGIWSRREPWAPANLEPLVAGLKQRGYCFATLREHPGYKAAP